MTRTVLENALLLHAIAGTDNIDDRGFAAPSPDKIPKYFENLNNRSKPKILAVLKVGIIAESLTGAVIDPRVKSTFLSAAGRLRKQGASVEDVSIPLHKRGPAIWTGVSKVAGYLAKTSGAPGRRGYQMWDLSSIMHPTKQDNWDNAYVS
jgi:amidase